MKHSRHLPGLTLRKKNGTEIIDTNTKHKDYISFFVQSAERYPFVFVILKGILPDKDR